MIFIYLLSQLTDRIFVGNVSYHDGCPLIVTNVLHLNREYIRICSWFMRVSELVVAVCVGVVIGKVIGTCVTFIKLIWKNSPYVLIRYLVWWILQSKGIIDVIPRTCYTFFFNHLDYWIWKLPGNIRRWVNCSFWFRLFFS